MRFNKGLITSLFLFIGSGVFAQKQTENILAPSPVRIDGKLTEWASTPFEVNKPTKLSYLVSNDKTNLYLVIRSEDSLTTSRILLTGIDFMVNTAGKKKEGPVITFPYIVKTVSAGTTAAAAGAAQPDIKALNRKVLTNIKEIKVAGFKDIKEPTISIYNEYSIKAAGSFDDKENLLYEVSIPLSLLGITPDYADDLAYNIKINGSANSQLAGAGGFGGRGGFGGDGGGDRGGNFGGGDRQVFVQGGQGGRGVFNPNRFYEATDFWISLKLAKPKN